MLLVIDNYDSFTWNLVHCVGEVMAEAGVEPDIVVKRNDEVTVDEAITLRPGAILLSPGPCDPNSAGICLALIERAGADTPILGVCLGHQAIGQAFGGDVKRSSALSHGKTSQIRHCNAGIFNGLPPTFRATRYHSLIVDRDTLPDCFEITADIEDGQIMGLRHKTYPVEGVQFHPESIATEHGHALLRNFLKRAELLPDQRTATVNTATVNKERGCPKI